MIKCTAPNCENKIEAKHYCMKHYMKMRRTGTLEKIKGTPKGNKINSEAHLSELTKLDPTPDPKRRGYLAVNIVNDIKYKAIQRGKNWELTNMDSYKLIISSCYYCGFTPEWPNNRVGIDRKDNQIGYIISNCVPCCFTCNSAKGELTAEEFYTWIKRLYNHSIK